MHCIPLVVSTHPLFKVHTVFTNDIIVYTDNSAWKCTLPCVCGGGGRLKLILEALGEVLNDIF